MPWLARGFVAGAAGTAAMAAWYHLERLLRRDNVTGVDALTDGSSATGLWAQTGLDYDDTVVPGRIVASILHLHNVTDRQAGVLTLGLRWSYGSAFGVAHVWLRKRLPEPAASIAFGGMLMTMTFTAFPVLGHTPTPWRWHPDVLASAVGSHGAYIVTAAVVDDVLR
jgi:hypothetical protein